LEPQPSFYIEHLLMIFREVRRVLRDDGTFWLNLADSYSRGPNGKHDYVPSYGDARKVLKAQESLNGLPPKNLLGVPWRTALALQEEGWYLRSDIIWHKPAAMPQSVEDRCTSAHEYIFMLTKSPRYFYDHEAVKEDRADDRPTDGHTGKSERNRGGRTDGYTKPNGIDLTHLRGKRNRRSVWTITSQPFADAHFATFSPEIPRITILAGTSAVGCCRFCGAPWRRVRVTERVTERGANASDYRANLKPPQQSSIYGYTKTPGWTPTCLCPGQRCGRDYQNLSRSIVLDPFSGAGTTAMVAKNNGRNSIAIEPNPKYCRMIASRVAQGLIL
jgi:DNA methylase